MKSLIENLNQLGGQLLQFAWPMLWQSSLLIAFVLALDVLLGRRIRASVRYALWLAVLVKLLLPPTLALPTSPVWWLHKTPPAIQAKPQFKNFTVTYDPAPLPEIPQNLPAFIPPKPRLSLVAWSLAASVFVSLMLCGWLLARWWQIARIVRRAATAENFSPALNEAWRLSGAPGTRPARFKNENQRAEPVLGAPKVGLKIVEGRMSPAVCGLFRQVILLPRTLAEHLSPAQLRAVLLHEMFHLRRKDVWVNCAQALLQIVYWWHPLLWFANARIRRLREEAVDDAVMLALRDEADGYAPTLLEVAKLVFRRPLLSLGLVGIMESRSALRQRIERLVDFRAPRRAGLTLVSLLGILAFTAVAVPMGEGPSPAEKPSAPDATAAEPRPQFALMFAMTHPVGGEVLKKQLLEAGVKIPPTIIHDFNNGRLFARGTKEQLVLVQQTIWRLNGYSPQEVAAATNIPGYAVKIPVDEPATPQLYSRTFKLGLDAIFANLLKQTGAQSNTNNSTVVSPAFRKLFVELGLNLESPPGKSIFYNERLGKLFTKATASDLDVIECAVMGLNQSSTQSGSGYSSSVDATNIVGITGVSDGSNSKVDTQIQPAQVEKQWVMPRAKVASPIANAYATNKLAYTGPGQQRIINKLDHIRLDNFSSDGLPLREVLRILSAQSKLRDPEHEGVNFLINSNPDKSGLPMVTNAAPVEDLAALPITLTLTNVMLADVLDAIVVVCHPVKYSIQDFAVVFSVKGPETPQLFSRVFKVDANVFYSGLKNFNTQSPNSVHTNGNPYAIGIGDGDPGGGRYVTIIDPASDVSVAARKFFITLGVNLDAPPGKSVFYNDRLGNLFVKATAEDLDKIERGLSALDQTTPQIHVPATNDIPSADGKTAPGVLADSNFVAATRAFSNFSTSFPASFHPAATGVADAAATNAAPPLYNRSFQVDPRTFFADLKKTGVGSDGTTDEAVLARNFFGSLGVNWESPPGKALFYGDKRGNLFVKATTEDLDKIERALSTLNQVAPQIHIKARFIEVPKGTLDGLKNIIAVTNPIVLSNQVAGFVGILTDKNFRTVLHNLEARSDVRNLAEPEVVTTSGRQTQMRATESVTIITNIVFEEYPTNQNGIVGSVTAKTGPLETGPFFDVVPYVLSDGCTLYLWMTASSMEFYGYAGIPTNMPPLTVTTSTGETVNPPRVWPAVLRYQKSAHVNLFDNQTVILALTNPEPVQFGEPDEKREAAVAKNIRATAWHNGGRNDILVFVTATIVDPAGNRVHSDDDLPFAQTGIPPQPK